MKYTFQHYYDIATSADSLTMIQIQAGGKYTLQRIKHLLGAYKYIKLGAVQAKFLPASTLPVDPLGLSYDDEDPQTIDPRDQMNPGLVRITNGEDLLTDFTGLTDKEQEQIYINTMLDPRWSKFMLQRGFKRTAVPLYWNVGQLHQDVFPGSHVNIPTFNFEGGDTGKPFVVCPTATHQYLPRSYPSTGVDAQGIVYEQEASDPRGLFQVGHRGRMGWMPTDAFQTFVGYETDSKAGARTEYVKQAMFQPLPQVNVITAILPKAYKTLYYYRLFITETVYLKGLKNTGVGYLDDGSNYEVRGVDNFLRVPMPTPIQPGQPYPLSYPDINDGDDSRV